MKNPDRRSLPRFTLSIPLRLRVLGLTREPADETTESLNVSHRGVSFATRRRFEPGTPIMVSIRIPREVTGRDEMEEGCYGRVVHAQKGIDGDGLICYGVVFEEFTSPA
ncbi:MAG: PilZ domain-containing protein [Candidatus Acidiferrales bacterium]|jgi:hypothetical protein